MESTSRRNIRGRGRTSQLAPETGGASVPVGNIDPALLPDFTYTPKPDAVSSLQGSPLPPHVPIDYSSQQNNEILQPFPLRAKPRAASARPPSRDPASGVGLKRPASSGRVAKPRTSRATTAPVSEKRQREQGIEAKSRANKRDGVQELQDAYYNLPENYRQDLLDDLALVEGREIHKVHQADLFRLSALALRHYKLMCFDTQAEVSEGSGNEQQNNLMAVDEEAIPDTNPIPAFPNMIPEEHTQQMQQWQHGPLGGFD